MSIECHELTLNEPAPAVADSDELGAMHAPALEHGAADDRVQSGAVSATGQDTDLHGALFLQTNENVTEAHLGARVAPALIDRGSAHYWRPSSASVSR